MLVKRDADDRSHESSAVEQRQLYRRLGVRGRRNAVKCPVCGTKNNVTTEKRVCLACVIRQGMK